MSNQTLINTGEFDRKDRDLLITLNVRVQDLIDTIKQMNGTLTKDIGALQEGKVDKTEFSTYCANHTKDTDTSSKEIDSIWKKYDKHELEIRSMSRMLWMGIGGIVVLQFLIPLFWPFK